MSLTFRLPIPLKYDNTIYCRGMNIKRYGNQTRLKFYQEWLRFRHDLLQVNTN